MRLVIAQRNAVLLAAFASLLAAQEPQPAGINFRQRLGQNADALKHYSYKRRTTIVVKGQQRGSRLDLVRYVDGKKETVALETPPRRAAPARRGLRGKIIENKIEKKKQEMNEELQQLRDMMAQYRDPGSDSMRKLFENAAVSRAGSGADAEVHIVAHGLSKPSDSFTLVWSVANRRPDNVEIKGEFKGKPVSIRTKYAALPDGPFYPAQTVIALPGKGLTINIDQFDYTLEGDVK